MDKHRRLSIRYSSLMHLSGRLHTPSTPTVLRLATITLNCTLDRVLLVPGLVPGQSQDAADQVTLPGGKGLNAARTAFALGSEVCVTGLIAGSCGQWIRALVHQVGISEHLLELPHGESRTSTILVDPERRHSTVIHDAAPSVPAGLWRSLRHQLVEAVQGYPWIAICGSCPSGLPRSVYADLCRDLESRGQRACLDARDGWLVDALAAQPYLVKCNQHEAARALDVPIETLAQVSTAARRWVGLGIEQVVITLGARGAIAANRTGTWHIAAPQVEALSSVGSGDAMMAGLIVALQRGLPLPAAARYGVAVGTANVLVLGSGCCDLKAIPTLLQQTRVTPVDTTASPRT